MTITPADMKYVLPTHGIVLLAVLYATGLIGGMTMATFFFLGGGGTILRAFEVSCLVAMATSCLAYLRKIYKAAISGRIEEARMGVQSGGTLIYFLVRPVFAAAFAAFGVMVYLLNFYGMAPACATSPTEGLVQMCAVAAFPIGYFVGRLLDRLDNDGRVTM